MLAIISPAKKLDFETESPVSDATDFRFAEEAQALIAHLRDYSTDEIKKLMKLSDALASLNAERYASWHPVMTEQNSKQALFAFKGDVYTGMSADTFTQQQITDAQSKLRILSGLYGLLRPLDRIQPYRLEMGTKLKTEQGSNLYQFWGSKLTDQLNLDIDEVQADMLINLASNEYFSAVQADRVKVPVITPVFKDEKNGEYKIRSFFAKKARGMMVRYILDESPTSEEALKKFNYGGYQFEPAESNATTWVFKRPEKA
nr:peroxide stress protein YaaA [Reinekea marinisedimentorum]